MGNDTSRERTRLIDIHLQSLVEDRDETNVYKKGLGMGNNTYRTQQREGLLRGTDLTTDLV